MDDGKIAIGRIKAILLETFGKPETEDGFANSMAALMHVSGELIYQTLVYDDAFSEVAVRNAASMATRQLYRVALEAKVEKPN